MIVAGAWADMHSVYPLPIVVAALAGALCFAGGCAGLIGIGDLNVVSGDAGAKDSFTPFDAIEGAPPSNDAEPDGASEDALSSDAGSDIAASGAVPCPSSPCTVGGICCADVVDGGVGLFCASGACSGGGSPINCVGPAGCEGGTPYCCASIVLNGGSVPTCVTQSARTDCAAQCITSIPVSCTTTDTLRLCAQPSDCDSNHSKCCAWSIGQLSAYICVDATQAASLNLLTCL